MRSTSRLVSPDPRTSLTGRAPPTFGRPSADLRPIFGRPSVDIDKSRPGWHVLRVGLTTLLWIALAYAAGALALSKVLLPWLNRQIDTGPGDGFGILVVRLFLRIWHRPRWIDAHLIPNPLPDGLIVASNHASGIDPLLLQTGFYRRIRWLMAKDQMTPALADAWAHLRMLPVHYGPEDAAVVREAVRHLRQGGLLGVFPEGGIVRPPGEIRPFLGGVGVIVARAKVPVLLFLIEDAPIAPTAFGSLVKPSRVSIRCLGLIDVADLPGARGGRPEPEAILAELRRRLAEASGWPLNDAPLVASSRSELAAGAAPTAQSIGSDA